MVLLEVINDELAEPLGDFYGEVKALLNLGVAPSDYTLILVKFFDEWQVYCYEGTINAIAVAQDELDADNLELADPEMAQQVKGNIFIVAGVLCDFSDGKFDVAEAEVNWWFASGGRIYLLMTVGDVKAVFIACDGNWNFIDIRPTSLDDVYYVKLGYDGDVWWYSTDSNCDVYLHNAGYGETAWLLIVSEATGEVDFAAMP